MELRIQSLKNAWEEKDVWQKLNVMSFVAFCLLIIDCTISGAGRWLMLGPLSLRMILGLFAMILAIPGIITLIKKWFRNPMLISLAIFILYLIYSAYIGIKHGNSMNVLITDIKGFAWLFMVPVAVAVVNTKARLQIVMRCIIFGAAIQALIILIINIVSIFNSAGSRIFLGYVFNLQIGFMENITVSMFRIFFKSGTYLVVACVCMFYFQLHEERFRWWYSIATGLCLNAVLLSFTRSLYGAAIVAALLTIVFYFIAATGKRKRWITHLATCILFFMALILFQQAISGAHYLRFAVARSLTMDVIGNQQPGTSPQPGEEAIDLGQQQRYIDRTKESDNNIRNIIVVELNAKIKQSPIFGNGLGSTIDLRAGGFVEYFYHDIMNKMGAMGLLLYCFPVAYMFFILLKEWKKGDRQITKLRIAWLCALSAFLVITYFNPYMNAVLGISCYSIAIACYMLEINIVPQSNDM